MDPRLRPAPIVAAVTLVLLASAVLGVLVRPADPVTSGPGTGAVEDPLAGGVACVTGAGPLATDADLLLVAAPGVPPEEEVVARGTVLTLGVAGADAADDPPRVAIGPVAPATLTPLTVTLGTDGWTWAGWADRTLLAWQEWDTPGAPGQPGGAVASACLPVDAQVQTLLGLSTVEGDEALIRLANPFTADATFAVTLVTPTEVLEPVALRNVSVRGGTRTTLRLNDHAPEQADIAAIVTVGAGRLAVEGLQRTVAAIGGVDGLASVPPVAAPSVGWTVPWIPSGPDVDGAVWIMNPAPRTVVVEVTVHAPDGATVPEGAASIEVGPGELRRVEVADLAVDGRAAVGVTLRSQTTQVLVAAGARFRAEDPARTGLVRIAAAPLPDPSWTVAGLTAPDRRTVLHVVNLSEEEVAPRIALTQRTVPEPALPDTTDAPTDAPADGVTDEVIDGGLVPPPDPVTVELTPAPIASGAVGRIVLPLEGSGAWSAVVTGGPGLVVSRTTLGDARLAPVALLASPSRDRRVVEPSLEGRELAGWVARLGTFADLRRPDVLPTLPPIEDGD